MNQQQSISSLKQTGYSVCLKTKKYSIMTRPFKDTHAGQVVFSNGEIVTLQSIDAVRAINNEEINMSKYYTKKMINELTEKERTALYNERTGKSVARIQRNNKMAVSAILETNPTIATSPQHDAAVAMEENEAIKLSAKDNAPSKPINPEDKVDLKVTKTSQRAITPPKEGTVCSDVWLLAGAMTDKTRAEVVAACVLQGINKATASTQYQRWKKYNESN